MAEAPFTTRYSLLAQEVRRVDEDRWLASRFAPAQVRARLTALYAVNYEIARAAETVSTPALGDIRLAWWREALHAIHDSPASHPALAAYAAACPDLANVRQVWGAIIDARALDVETAPFTSFDALADYVDATAGALMRIAVRAAGSDLSPSVAGFVEHGARAWGFTGLLRAAPVWAARGRTLPPPGCTPSDLKSAALAAYFSARAAASALPARVFPAIGYVALAPLYLRNLEKPPSLIARQMKLIAASATGRL